MLLLQVRVARAAAWAQARRLDQARSELEAILPTVPTGDRQWRATVVAQLRAAAEMCGDHETAQAWRSEADRLRVRTAIASPAR